MGRRKQSLTRLGVPSVLVLVFIRAFVQGWPVVEQDQLGFLPAESLIEHLPDQAQEPNQDMLPLDTCSHANDIRTPTSKVPDRYHLLHVAESNDDLDFPAYLTIKSIHVNARPADGIYFHCIHVPHGPWWDMVKHLVAIVHIKKFTTFMGHTLKHHRHWTDILRMDILDTYGGVYVDLDTLVLRPLRPLYYHDAVLGWEAGQRTLVNNGVIVASPNTTIIKRYMAGFAHYTGHSDFPLHTTARLALAFPKEVCIMPPQAFYQPLWTVWGVQHMHTTRYRQDVTEYLKKSPGGHVLMYDGQYSYNMWWKSVQARCFHIPLPNITYLKTMDSFFTHLVRPILEDVHSFPPNPYTEEQHECIPQEVSDP